jgi:glycogen debranching enzyme
MNVIDVDHRPGAVDPSFRPNQIFAVGGLPLVLLPTKRRHRSWKPSRRRFGHRWVCVPWLPVNLATYRAMKVTSGNRDTAYHQGTVWPWLIGPFIEAWVRVRGNTPEAKKLARKKFIDQLQNHLDQAGLGHVSEITDADPPHTPRGCPFQAWSLGELLLLDRVVLA